jgi:hypothetical protein
MRYLSTFLSEFHGGFQRGARFECQLYPNQGFLSSLLSGSILTNIIDILTPTIGQRIDPKFSLPNVVQWLARGLVITDAILPARALETTKLNMYGISEEFPYSTEYNDITCTFIMPLNASDCPLPRFFNYWQNYIHSNYNGPEDGLDFRFPEDYYGRMMLSTFDAQDHPSLTYLFEKLYPKTVNSTQVSWNDTNEALQFTVSFAYSYWKILPYQPPPLIEINLEF